LIVNFKLVQRLVKAK